MDKQRILINIDVAIAAVTAQPDPAFDLGNYVRHTDCGTLYCTAGLLTTLPHFRAQGWDWDGDSDNPWPEINGCDLASSCRTDEQFGPDAWGNLFTPRGDGNLDDDLLGFLRGKLGRRGTDKELALARLESQRRIVEDL